jgi:hypothetical protein
VQLFVFDQLFNRAHQDRKTTAGAIRLQEEDLVLHHGISEKIVIFEFHTAFLWPARTLGRTPEPTSNRLFPALLFASIALTQHNCQKCIGETRFSLQFLKQLGRFVPLWVRESLSTFGCLDTFAPFDTFRAELTEKLIV